MKNRTNKERKAGFIATLVLLILTVFCILLALIDIISTGDDEMNRRETIEILIVAGVTFTMVSNTLVWDL